MTNKVLYIKHYIKTNTLHSFIVYVALFIDN